MDLYVNLGFKKNPFSKFSAEEEQIYLKEIYEIPRYYQTLLEEIAEGNSRYLLGERGVGKSALMFCLIEDLKQKGVYSVLIDQYDGIPSKNNGPEFLFLVEQHVVTNLGIELMYDKTRIRKLKKEDREKLAFLGSVI